MSWGTASEIFNGNNVLFDLDDSGNTLQEVILCREFRMIKDVPINRSNPREGPVDTPGQVLREFHILADITEDLFDRLDALSEPTTRGALTEFTVRMRAQAPTASDDATVTAEAICRHIEFVGQEQNKAQARFIIRAKNSTVVIS